ncbi:MAG TPA: DUF692 domain-containing protein [Elusimicrobiota bacterium]|nr:DUF692 domain-containing protein [Elusimicrobiota bacterium]
MSDYSSLPVLGAGIGLRKQHFKDLPKTVLPVGWLEVIPENFMAFGGYPKAVLERVAGRWPVVSHGVNLSIGSCDPLNEEYVDRLKTLLEQTKALWFSDHLCFTSVGGDYVHDLLALPFSQEAVDHVAKRVAQLKRQIHLPFLLENISYYVAMPGAEMDEAEFIRRVLETADCGMLLDVNNVYVNSRNHGYDAKEFIRRLPLERVGQIHLAGHLDRGDVVIDTHEGPIIDPVWELYEFTLNEMQRPVSTLIEWDTNVPPLADVVAEALRAERRLAALGYRPPAKDAAHPASTDIDTLLEPARSPLAERREAAGAPA